MKALYMELICKEWSLLIKQNVRGEVIVRPVYLILCTLANYGFPHTSAEFTNTIKTMTYKAYDLPSSYTLVDQEVLNYLSLTCFAYMLCY